jgi:hypothetical protein
MPQVTISNVAARIDAGACFMALTLLAVETEFSDGPLKDAHRTIQKFRCLPLRSTNGLLRRST